MKHDIVLGKMLETFRISEYSAMTEDWEREVINYLYHGFCPGSFHTAVIEGDLFEAVCRSHPMNEWSMIRAFVRWFMHYAPCQSFGHKGAVNEWLNIPKESRIKILEQKNLIYTSWELLSLSPEKLRELNQENA